MKYVNFIQGWKFMSSYIWEFVSVFETVPKVTSYGLEIIHLESRLKHLLSYLHDDVIMFMIHEWWRHQMEAFSALLDLCAENSRVTAKFPSQWPVTWSFDVFFDLRLC